MKNRVLMLLAILSVSGCNSEEDFSNEALNIEDGRWELQSYGYEVDVKSSVIAGTEYSLKIVSDNGLIEGNATGSFDCNSYAADASYSESSNEISISNFYIVTDAICALSSDEDYEQQNSFIESALNGAIGYEIIDQTLTISSVDSAQLIFLNISD